MISESQRLKARGADGWAAAVAHPMVAEIGAGSLPHATFRFYFEQNLGYLREYARAIAFAATATTDRGALSTLARFLGQIADGVILILESNLTRRETARAVKENLAAANVKILGAVLNNHTFSIPETLYKKL